MLNLVVFSKDRPAQLDLLLRSLERFFPAWRDENVAVLHTSSDERYAEGYRRLAGLHPDVRLVPESGAFKDETLALLDPVQPLTAFLVDDDAFVAPFSLDAPEVQAFRGNGDVMFLSLRLCPRIDYCYTLDSPAAPAALRPDGTWFWRHGTGDWGYPMSLDGHLFRTEQLLPLLRSVDFHHPNSLESALAEQPLPGPLGLCFAESRIINVPANRVQSTHRNRCGDVPAQALNERFLAGERIVLESVLGVENRAPHHELEYRWERESGEAPVATPTPLRAKLDVGLLVIATADYVGYAARLVESAQRHFLPGHRILPFLFSDGQLGPSRLGFPAATLYRYHVFLEHRERLAQCDYLFYCDADMLFVDTVGEEVLGRITATLHPGYVGQRGTYEDRPESTAYVAPHEGSDYFCGGFNGGEAEAFLALAQECAQRIDVDDAAGVLAVWHDESHLNRHLATSPPEVVLSPSYCYPEVVFDHYRRIWPEEYRPKLVALDKEHGQYKHARRAA